jgi:hypothetical protein
MKRDISMTVNSSGHLRILFLQQGVPEEFFRQELRSTIANRLV